jgi:uncharacterized membrane protein
MNSSVDAYPAKLKLRLIPILLAIAGLIDSLYLGWLKLSGNTAACSTIGDCESVNLSRFADIGGIPVALIGALGYAIILGLLSIEGRFPAWSDNIQLMYFGLTLVGTLYSAYLTYIELFVIKAVCPFCVVSAVIMVILFLDSVFRLRNSEWSS